MVDLLSYQTRRLLNIAEFLITQSPSCSIDSLQDLNQCSRKTVYDDLRLLKERWPWVLNLEIHHNHITNHERSVSQLIQFKENLYHEELKINILKSIFCHPYSTILDLTFQLNYSESSIRKNIREINKYLKPLKMAIVHDDYHYYLKGETEHTVRFFMKNLLSVGGFLNKGIYFSNEELAKFELFTRKNDLKFTENLKKEALILYFCILTREKQGFNDQYFEQSSAYIQEDILFYQNLTKDTMESFLQENQLTITNYDYQLLINILVMIGFSARALPYHMDLYINRYQYFLNSFRKENPSFTESYIHYIQTLDEQTGIHFSRYAGEILFHLYTHVSTRRYRSLKIGVFSDIGTQHAQTILLFMQKHFPNQRSELYQPQSDYDLIVCTNHLQEFNAPFVTVSDFLTEEDIKNIYKAIFIDNNTFSLQKRSSP